MNKETHELIENKIMERARARFQDMVKSHTDQLRNIFNNNKPRPTYKEIEDRFENAMLLIEKEIESILIPNLIDKETKDILAKIDQILAD